MNSPQSRSYNRGEIKFLHPITVDCTSLRGRIAILCLPPDDSSQIIDKIILFIEYSQCIALTFFSSSQIYDLEKNP